ncbi:MAG TPA: LysR family transcriptional regulator [Burkholderiaceae bacterium]|nr:LysR family transcriptional regulator [Burkholderiaceae bacterium]
MNDRQLRHFVVLGELLNFRKTAQKLNIVQPALSASIKRLEEEFGAALFERSTREVRLTAAGEAALGEATKALRHLERAMRNAAESAAGNRGQLSIGFVGSASFALLPLGVRAFRTEYPKVVLSLQESTSSRILAMIEAGDIDVGLIRTPAVYSPGVAIDPVANDQLVAVVPTDSPWSPTPRARSIVLKRLANAPFINFAFKEAPMLHMAVVNCCREAGFSPNIVQEAIQVQTVITLVESGLGVGLVPAVSRHHKPANARFLRLLPATAASRTGLALAYKPDGLSVVGRNFVDTMRRVAKSKHLKQSLNHGDEHTAVPAKRLRRGENAR